jgi:hypothetical protein
VNVRIEELRRAANLIIDHLEEIGVTFVDIDEDHYWDISPENLYQVYEQPAALSIGQLSDDVAEIRAIASGSKKPLAFALTWLAPILRYVGAKVIK